MYELVHNLTFSWLGIFQSDTYTGIVASYKKKTELEKALGCPMNTVMDKI